MNSDRSLVAEAGTGSREAFDELVRRYRRSVYNLVRASSAGDSDAEDLVQDIFVRAYRAIGSFRGESSFRSWLYRIAINVVRSHRDRRRLTSGAGSLRVEDSGALEDIAAPEDVEASLDRRRAIDRALATLSEDQRLLIVLRDVEGLTYDELAKVVKIPRGTVDSRLFRARQRLRASLEGYGATRPSVDVVLDCDAAPFAIRGDDDDR